MVSLLMSMMALSSPRQAAGLFFGNGFVEFFFIALVAERLRQPGSIAVEGAGFKAQFPAQAIGIGDLIPVALLGRLIVLLMAR